MTFYYFHKLTVERCQHNMAQLAAALYTGPFLENATPAGQTVKALIEILNRDLEMLREIDWEENTGTLANDNAGHL